MKTIRIIQTLRYFWKNKLFSIVNILGLSISFVLILLLTAYITNEKSVDGFHKNHDRIYRVTRAGECAFSPPFGQYVTDNIEGVDSFCRTFILNANIKSDFNLVKSSFCYYTDANFFTMFSFPLIEGTPQTVLAARNNVVLSETFAKKMFPNNDPIGKIIRINNRLNYQVSGVMKDFDENTHFKQADVLFPFEALNDYFGNPQYSTQYDLRYFMPSLYVLAKEGSDLSTKGTELYVKAHKWYWLFQQDESNKTIFQPLNEVYFNAATYGFPMGARDGNSKLLKLMITIVSGIFIIALLNFLNLTLTYSFRRNKEFGIKKIIGINKMQFIGQSFIETLLLYIFSMLIALIILWLMLPSFNLLTGYHFTLLKFISTLNWQKLLFPAISVYVITAIVPALVISRFSPATIIRKTVGNIQIKLLQQILVVLQFIVAIALISSMIVIQKQSNYLINYNTGFNKTETFYINLNAEIKNQKLLYKEELSKIKGVEAVALCNGMPGVGISELRFEVNNKTQSLDYINVDEDYFKVMEIDLKNPSLIGSNGIWINETAARTLNYNANDKLVEIDWYGTKMNAPVNEVLPDMNYRSLYEPCRPLMLTKLEPQGWVDYALLRINMVNRNQILNEAEKIHKRYSPDFPFDYSFLNDTINKAYEKEKQTSKIVSWFSIFAILISSMGLFALSVFTINARIKEIGIRKVNGARISEVLAMLNKDFIKWVAIAFVIAIPVAWYAMHIWLENFAYKTALSWWIFALSGGLALLIALFTVSGQSWKAANRNPVEALRYE
jgi:putative ABC transport system permease protein